MQQPSVLLTVAPPIDYPGSVPSEPISRCLARLLLDSGESVRVLAQGAQTLDWPDEVEVIEGSIARPFEAAAAFEQMSALFLAGADPATVYDALAMARAGGATKVVTLSSHGPDIEITLPPDHWHWLAIEVVVERSGLAWTHIIPSLIMAATLTNSYPLIGKSWRDLIRSGQPIKRPFAHARFPFIHERDLAAIIAATLRDPACDGMTIHATGKGISDLERVETLRAVLGREIAFEPLSREQAVAFYQEQGLDDHAIAYLLDTAAWFAEHPENRSAEAERILGRPLRTYAEWAREHAAAFL